MPPKKSFKKVEKPKPSSSEEEEVDEVLAEAAEAALVETKKPKKKAKKLPTPEETEESSEADVEEDYKPANWKPSFKADKPFSAMCLASRNSGKSFLTKYIFSQVLRGYFNVAFVITQTPDEREEYVEVFTKQGVVARGYDDIPETLWTDIKTNFEKRRSEGLSPLKIAVLIDDVGQVMRQNKDVVEMYTQARHFSLSIWWNSQHTSLIGTVVRGNSDIVVVLKLKSNQLKKSVLDNILRGTVELPPDVSPADELRFYTQLLATYVKKQGDALICDLRPPGDRGNTGDDELFQFRAPPVEKWPFKEAKQ
jgi:hypothetical protein